MTPVLLFEYFCAVAGGLAVIGVIAALAILAYVLAIGLTDNSSGNDRS